MEDSFPDLQALLDETAGKAGVPGAAVGIHHRGRDTVLSTGSTSLESGQAVDENTLFMIGSTTKTFTAALLMTLVEEGTLDLDTPVVAYLPEFELADPAARELITARHLLTHTGGFLGDRDIETGWGDGALAAAVRQFDELPQTFRPGSTFSYSNTGFLLAGHLAEVLTRTPYEDLVRTRILEPLGMTESFFLPWEVLVRPHAVGHALMDGRPTVSRSLGISRAGNPAGGLWSSARDQLRWARFFLSGDTSGSRPFSEAGRTALIQPQRPAALAFEEVGLSWLRTRHGDIDLVRHGGNVSFLQVSEFVMIPEREFAVTVLTNSGGGGALGTAVLHWATEHIANLAPPSPRQAIAVPVSRLADYTGRFETGDLAIDITRSGDVLRAQMVLPEDAGVTAPPPFEIAFVDDDVFARAADTRHRSGRFHRNEHGKVTLVEIGGRTAMRDISPVA
ncbi:serine hydrolase [Amycolatopsis thailandensis]|uniref:serine hydrolase n=1 Tax=Amycolatopsis thailandensis TaxID=589330 RepID=UPI00365AF27E